MTMLVTLSFRAADGVRLYWRRFCCVGRYADEFPSLSKVLCKGVLNAAKYRTWWKRHGVAGKECQLAQGLVFVVVLVENNSPG